MTLAVEAEAILQRLEAADSLGTSMSSGFSTSVMFVKEHEAFKAVLDFFKANPTLALPTFLDRVATYLKVQPGQYEHPNDATVLALLLMVEELFPASPEATVFMKIAELLPNPWWTRQFIERRRAASQSKA